jgi:hypothetical protein
MDRDEAVEIIVRATKWLYASPETFTGVESEDGTYSVAVSAATGRIDRVRGVYFGATISGKGRHDDEQSTPLVLTDCADPASSDDYIPVTNTPGKDDPRLWDQSNRGIDMRVLDSFPDAQLERMAANAVRILEEYNSFYVVI